MTHSRHVLIGVVDDDPGVRTALRQLLRAGGYEALAFCSAEDFLGSPSRGSVGCLVVDVNLPGMTGVALLEALGGNGTTPAVLMTARDDPGTLELLLQAAPVPHLRKPFSDSELFDAIERVLRA